MSMLWPIIVPLVGLELVLMIVALVSLVKEENPNGPKWLWALVIIFVSIFGPVAYFAFGKRQERDRR
ncbi:PLD nuclease N-terminal domain-containing protein [Paenibacillus caui]|uniref:PLD nuclease N-terminal domain-containing protein n=1 Tax=Paenibacillus caui TaxID=2873927 RepID=UPI001F19951C|nr:PLD nuclease N-terminal domain-containing protein [Paenibacillus caui]